MDGQFADISLRPLELEKSARLSPPSSSFPSPKRSRRSVQKRVVSVPIGETDGPRPKGVSEGAPPSDSWAWRKYGQKPIKGSPYPRGYYRCSSSKGCPARKQVERSRLDPTMLVVTYSCEHNHPWPVPKNSHLHHHQTAASKNPVEEDPDPETDPIHQQSPPESANQDEKFADLIGEAPALMLPDDFWYSDVGSTSSTSPILYGPIFGSASAQLATDEFDGVGSGEEEDSLFAGLGELPEYSMVFRRGNLDGRMTAAAWCGTTS